MRAIAGQRSPPPCKRSAAGTALSRTDSSKEPTTRQSPRSCASISQWNAFWQTGVQAKTVSIVDVGNGYSYGATATYRGHPDYTNRYMVRGALTYATGSHSFKTGFQREHLKTDNFFLANGNVQYTFRNGVPQSILQRTTPYLELDRTDDLGIFAQDQWKLNKFTFNYGLRFDYVNGYTPNEDIPGQPDPKFFDRFPGVPA